MNVSGSSCEIPRNFCGVTKALESAKRVDSKTGVESFIRVAIVLLYLNGKRILVG